MKMSKEPFIQNIISYANKYDIELSNEKAYKFYQYKELLLEWNEKINLTAITDDEDIIVKHFIDCLICNKFVKNCKNLVDVGTGAGFPGIVLAIYYDGSVDITLVDALNKRINFLNDVIEKLELKNVKTIHGRAEEVAHNVECREKFDVAIARAVAPLNILLEYLSGYVKLGGKCICMKSVNVEEELQNAQKAIKELDLKFIKNDRFNIEYNEEVMTRNVLTFEKVKLNGEKYPRMYAKIKKSPL